MSAPNQWPTNYLPGKNITVSCLRLSVLVWSLLDDDRDFGDVDSVGLILSLGKL